jgi:hypothetical protein
MRRRRALGFRLNPATLAGVLLLAPAASAQPAKRAPSTAELAAEDAAKPPPKPAPSAAELAAEDAAKPRPKPAPNEAELAEAAAKPAPQPDTNPASPPGARPLPPKTLPFGGTCPECPAGFVCSNGMCGPKPHLVCPSGYVLVGEICALEREGAPGQVDLEEQRLWAARLLQRARPKFTLDLQVGYAVIAPTAWPAHTSVFTPTAMLLFGGRQNYQPKLGVAYRGGLLLGMPSLDYDDSTTIPSASYSDSTFMTGFVLEAMPYFGPYGRFYVGPLVFVGAVGFVDNNLDAGPTGERFHLAGGLMGGAGVAGGFVVGDHEQTDLNFAIRLDFNPEHKMTLFLMAGVGLHRLWSRN